jgi:hypothetical protein
VRLFNKKGGGSSGCKCRDYSIFNSRFELTFFHQQKPIFFSLFFIFLFYFSLARHAWLLSSGCGVYHGHAGSSSSRLLRLSLGASKRAAATTSSSTGGLLGRPTHHLTSPHSASVEVPPASSSPASASFCDLKTKRKIRDKAIKTSRSTPSSGPCPVMPRDPMTDGPIGKNSRTISSRRPLTRSVLRASLSPLGSGPGTPSGSGASKKVLAHHGSPSIKASGIAHPRRLLATHALLPK